MQHPDPRTALLLRQLALAFDRRSWHGPNLLGSLRGVSPDAAAWRPQPQRHNIWEIAVHCAYWKYRVCRLVAPEGAASFTLKGSDWFVRPETSTKEAWVEDVMLLRSWHDQLLQHVRVLESDRLDEPSGRGEFTIFEVVSGIVAHDAYHAGQVRLLRRMRGSESESES